MSGETQYARNSARGGDAVSEIQVCGCRWIDGRCMMGDMCAEHRAEGEAIWRLYQTTEQQIRLRRIYERAKENGWSVVQDDEP